jgi:hypothetical protein
MILSVRRDDSDELRKHVVRDHYLHRWPDPRALPFGYALEVDGQRHMPDGRICGLVVMKKPQHHRHRGLFGYPDLPTEWQVLDLARVWIHPWLQDDPSETHHEEVPYCINRHGQLVPKRGNVFSQMVSKVLHRVQWDWLRHHPPVYPDLPYHIVLIISYCELAHHDGTAYRASGFTRFSTTGDGTKELYIRRLRAPLRSWRPRVEGIQLALWQERTIEHV